MLKQPKRTSPKAYFAATGAVEPFGFAVFGEMGEDVGIGAGSEEMGIGVGFLEVDLVEGTA